MNVELPPRPASGLGPIERTTLVLASAALLAGATRAMFTLPLHLDLVAAAGVVLIAIFFVVPRPAVVLLVALQVSIGMLWWVPGTIADLGILELFGGVSSLLVLVLAVAGLREVERTAVFVPIATLGILLVVAATRAPSWVTGLGVLVRYAGPLVLALVLAARFPEQDAQRAAWNGLALAILPPAVVSVAALVAGQTESVTLAGIPRLVGGFQDISAHGQVMAVGTALLMGTAPLVSDRWRRAAWVLAAVTASCVFLSHSRTAQVGLVAFVLVWLAASGRRTAFAVTVAGLALAVTTSTLLQERFDDLVSWISIDPLDGPEALDDLGSGRVRIWRYSIESFFRRSPLDLVLGVGLGDHRSLYLETRTSGKATHNDWLALAFQAGPAASLVYAWVLVVIVRSVQVIRRLAPPSSLERGVADTVGGLVGMVLVMNFFSNAFVSRVNTAWLFWAAAGLVIAVRHRLERERALDGSSRSQV